MPLDALLMLVFGLVVIFGGLFYFTGIAIKSKKTYDPDDQ